MKRFISVFLASACSVLISVGVFAQTVRQIRSENTGTGENETLTVKCIPPDNITNNLTPIDLTDAMLECVRHDRYEDATFLYVMSGVYAKYDRLRNDDPSASEGISLLRMIAIDSLGEKKATFKRKVLDRMHNRSTRMSTCKEIDAIGAPAYAPNYMDTADPKSMVKHEKTAPFRAGFNPQVAWQEALVGYLQCD